jgi:cell wall-associated NlpC family hydrolase
MAQVGRGVREVNGVATTPDTAETTSVTTGSTSIRIEPRVEPRVASTRPDRRWRRGLLAAVALGGALTVAISGTSAAVPPPPPNPSNSQISAAQAQANAKAGAVGALTNQLAAAQGKLQDLQDQVELKQEDADKALVDLQNAQDAADAAQAAVASAKIAANAAGNAIDEAQQQADAFALGSWEQGGQLGSVANYFNATSPKDLLERQRLLQAMSGSEDEVLDQLQRARTQQANADSAARAALAVAQQKQDAATRAKGTADAAVKAAESAQANEQAQATQLQSQQASLQQQLSAAQSQVSDLNAERATYQNWLAAKQAEDARNAAAAAAAHTGGGGGGGGRVGSLPAGAAGIVIRRALAELGLPYVWGGGNASGPTHGVAGDPYDPGYATQTGFDCSGLMVYAFAGVGISLPHFSGYQYTAGQHVPLSGMRAGDMLFYGGGAGIHHVTLYIGNGMMIEAPESGQVVHVTPVRMYGGIMPFAVRLL